MNKIDKKEIEYNFLIDKPVEDGEELKFGHYELGETLVDIVRKCKTPFTIGLFGRWGSGKSTLAHFLRAELQTRKIPVIIFDVWKHEKDNILRRAFLKELVSQLKEEYGRKKINKDIFEIGDDRFEINDRIDSAITKNNEGKIKINWEKVKQAREILVLFVLIGLLIAIIPSSILTSWRMFWTILSWMISLVFGGTVLIWLLKITTTFFYTETTTIGRDRFQDPSEFEKEFKRILEAIRKDYEKILIVFDNIDRVSSDKALEVLSAIKTFLEPDKKVMKRDVVFLVPCDAQALRKHIMDIYQVENTSAYDPDEFLRKFFSTTIRIPDFFVTEMELYVRSKLENTNVAHFNNDLISALITIAFRDNPRQVIQFINVLLASYLLILHRCGENEDFDSDFLDKRTPELCRYLLLESRFPAIMEKIKEKNIYDVDSVDIQQLKNMGLEDKNSIFDKFIDIKKRTVNLAPLKNARIFYTMRRSNEEKEFSGINDFFIALEEQESESAQGFIKGIDNFQKKRPSLSRLISDRLEKITNPIMKARFIDSLLSVLYKEKKDLEESTVSSIYTATENLELMCLIYIQPNVFAEIMLKHKKEWRRPTFDRWISIISKKTEEDKQEKISDDFMEILLSVFISRIGWLTQQQISKVVKNIVQPVFFMPSSGKLLTANLGIQDQLVSEDYVRGFIENMTTGDITQEIPENIKIVTKFKDKFFTENTSNELLRKFTEILKEAQEGIEISDFLENEKGIPSKNVYMHLNKLMLEKKDIFSKVDDKPLWNDVLDDINELNSSTDTNNRKIFMPLCFSLWLVVPDGIKNQLETYISDFIQQASLESVKYFISNSGNQILSEGEEFMEGLENQALQDDDYFNYLYNEFYKDPDLKYNILIKLINTDLMSALSKIKSEHANLPKKADVINKILDKFDNTSNQDKSEIIEICNLTKCAKNTVLRDKLGEKIKTLLTQPNKEQQVIMQGVASKLNYFGDKKLRQISTDIFDWIKHQGLAGSYHVVPITFIYDLKQLTAEELNELPYYIFQILRTSNDPAELELAKDVLLKVKPKRKDKQQELTDIEGRIEAEGNDTIKQILRQVLDAV
ncbi:MAG: hypothetical protein KAJ66_02115 [Candidatus Omnitrophica bacterium]|nr:hypothetical protein [Candidatus Omnitrophota bacterium]